MVHSGSIVIDQVKFVALYSKTLFQCVNKPELPGNKILNVPTNKKVVFIGTEPRNDIYTEGDIATNQVHNIRLPSEALKI